MAARKEGALGMHAVIDTSVASMIHNSLNGCGIDPFYEAQMIGKKILISFQTVEEMLFGAHKAGWGGPRVQALSTFLKGFVVVPGNYELAEISARLRADAEKVGRRLETADAWIMATAIKLGVPLVTDDRDQALGGVQGYSFMSKHPAFILPLFPSGLSVGSP
jgi:predicted nucleic acid-binding protein